MKIYGPSHEHILVTLFRNVLYLDSRAQTPILAFTRQNSIILYCRKLHVGQQRYKGNTLLRLHWNANAPLCYVICALSILLENTNTNIIVQASSYPTKKFHVTQLCVILPSHGRSRDHFSKYTPPTFISVFCFSSLTAMFAPLITVYLIRIQWLSCITAAIPFICLYPNSPIWTTQAFSFIR